MRKYDADEEIPQVYHKVITYGLIPATILYLAYVMLFRADIVSESGAISIILVIIAVLLVLEMGLWFKMKYGYYMILCLNIFGAVGCLMNLLQSISGRYSDFTMYEVGGTFAIYDTIGIALGVITALYYLKRKAMFGKHIAAAKGQEDSEQVTVVVCDKCGTENPITAQFCNTCGQPIAFTKSADVANK